MHNLLAGFEHFHSYPALATNLLIIVHCYGVRGTTDNKDGTLVVHLSIFGRRSSDLTDMPTI